MKVTHERSIREREIILFTKANVQYQYHKTFIWQASRRDNPSSWLPVAMITVRLKV